MSKQNGQVREVVPVAAPPSPFSEATQARLDRAAQRLLQAQQRLQMAQQTLQGAQNEAVQQDGRLKGILEAALEEVGLSLDTDARVENGRVIIPSWQPSEPAKRAAKR